MPYRQSRRAGFQPANLVARGTSSTEIESAVTLRGFLDIALRQHLHFGLNFRSGGLQLEISHVDTHGVCVGHSAVLTRSPTPGVSDLDNRAAHVLAILRR